VTALVVGPGKAVRFAVVADDGRRSEAWTVWTSRRTLDAYVTARRLGRAWRTCMHASGHWHSGFHGPAPPTTATDVPTTFRDLWMRPSDFAPGIRQGVEVMIPDVELRRWPVGMADDKPVVRIPAPGPARATCVDLVFMDAAQPTDLEVDDAIHVASLAFNDGSVMHVVARRLPWAPEDEVWAGAQRAALIGRLPSAARLLPRPRAIIMGKHADERRFMLELAVDP
jgi:hypothetical protein